MLLHTSILAAGLFLFQNLDSDATFCVHRGHDRDRSAAVHNTGEFLASSPLQVLIKVFQPVRHSRVSIVLLFGVLGVIKVYGVVRSLRLNVRGLLLRAGVTRESYTYVDVRRWHGEPGRG